MGSIPRRTAPLVGGALVVVVVAALAVVANRTAPIRGSLDTLTTLIEAGDRGDLEAARSLCSRRYLSEGGPIAAEGGGLVGLPRSIRRNFRAWREGEDVLLCPTGRTGPVYRFVREGGRWRFDGGAGLLGSGG